MSQDEENCEEFEVTFSKDRIVFYNLSLYIILVESSKLCSLLYQENII